MNLPNLRLMKSPQGIHQLLQVIHSKNPHVSIWQMIKNRRIHIEAEMVVLDQKRKTFTLKTDQKYLFSPSRDVFFFSPYKTVLFKCPIAGLHENQITLRYPVELRTVEKRSVPRWSFDGSEKQIVLLSKLSGYRSLNRRYEKPLLDLGNGGFGFIISPLEFTHFAEGDKVKIDRLLFPGSFPPKKPDPLLGQVAYIIHKKFDPDQSGFRVGVSFL